VLNFGARCKSEYKYGNPWWLIVYIFCHQCLKQLTDLGYASKNIADVTTVAGLVTVPALGLNKKIATEHLIPGTGNNKLVMHTATNSILQNRKVGTGIHITGSWYSLLRTGSYFHAIPHSAINTFSFAGTY
jgi:hypothetical protein